MTTIFFFFLTGAIFGTVAYLYLRREQDKIITKDKDGNYFYDIFQALKYPPLPLLVFFGVAGIHYLIVRLQNAYIENSIIGALVGFSLAVPNFILYLFDELFLQPIFEPSPTKDRILRFLVEPTSSFLYGIMGALLASRKAHLRLISIFLICLFVIFGCFFILVGALWARGG